MSDSRSDDSATAQPPNKKARSDITDGWQPIPTRYSQLMSFHQTWWGKHAAVLEQYNAIVTVADSLPTQVALNMRQSKGMMLVREEYLRLYTQLCELHEAMYTGVAIIGQPGIGKSYFNIYALLRRMATSRQVLFSTSDGDVYRFDEEGVRWMNKADVTLKDLPDLDSDERMVWSLIDADDKPVQHQKVAQSMMFAVLATSPKKNRYSKWFEKNVDLVKCLVAEVWTNEELHIWLSHDGLSNLSEAARGPYRTLDGVKKLVNDVGPCPRDIISHITDPSVIQKKAKTAIKDILTVEQLFRLLDEDDKDIDKASHSLILVRRNGDSMAVSIKTVQIASMLLERLAHLRSQSAHSLFLAAVANAETKVMAGRIFELLAIQHTRGERPALQSRGFHAMKSLTSTKTYPHRFQHTLTTPKRVIYVEQDKSTLGVPELQESWIPFNSSAADSRSLNQERRLIEYATLAECALDPEEYYRPRNPTNPFFDSFFLHEGQDNIVVWVFLMTIAKDHDGKTSGFVILAELVARVQNKFPQKKVELKYVLVVPYQPDVAVRWHLSPGWDEVRGEVYVLYLDSFAPFNAFF